MTDQDQGYTFNWHALDEHSDYHGDEFLKWMVPTLLSEHDDDHQTRADMDHVLNRVGEASDDFKNVVMTIQLNGIDVNVEHFVHNVFLNMRWYARRAALEELRQRADVTQLTDVVSQFQDTVTTRAIEIAHSMGITLNKDGDAI